MLALFYDNTDGTKKPMCIGTGLALIIGVSKALLNKQIKEVAYDSSSIINP